MTRFMMLAQLAVCAVLLLSSAIVAVKAEEEEKSFFDFSVKDVDGKLVSLRQFADKKAILVVNVASECGYTDQNYRELQTLYEKYQGQGLEILAFPCNQFGSQEPRSGNDIIDFVQGQYQVTFPIFAKIDVNGENADALFTYLKTKLTGFVTNDIKWNFTKFLIVNGEPFKRYATHTSPFSIESDIVEALNQVVEAKEDGRDDL
ncbi:TPA: hypothetical protein N0F65_004767 [Lagenidium giganteum]|uniref:Glutathione peroxidase n=1 Tax=Lagenidium giganteum TaxID=4803 RepID=A0AAV2YUT5_9STRA|nr:TPA: hypothetical protein N0F65_004767 [Lagenidium giganteum]